ncbi:MAG: 2-phospho-L-lactate guanylyltransferase [Pseudomonadota bacterium]
MVARDIWGVLPIKDYGTVMQRLAAAMTQEERTTLFAASVEDVLESLSACSSLAGVLVVTRDSRGKALADKYGARVVLEDENRGHTAATSLGAEALAAEGRGGMLQVPGDMPLLDPTDIDAVLAAHLNAPAVTIAPSSDEMGSNCVVSSPPDFLPLRFGDNSFFPHCDAARSLGVEPTIVRRPAFELDLDTPEDLARFVQEPSETRAYVYLQQAGIVHRVLRATG